MHDRTAPQQVGTQLVGIWHEPYTTETLAQAAAESEKREKQAVD